MWLAWTDGGRGRFIYGEFNLFPIWIVVYWLGFFFMLRFFRTLTATHMNGHRNLLQIAQRIEYLTDEGNRFHAEVGEEADGYQCQQRRKTRCAYKTFYLLADGQSVVATRIVASTIKEWFKELCESHGTPNHDDCQTHKPLE